MGKTRLVEVLAHAAQEAGLRVVWGRPQQYAEDFPYLCFLQIASELEAPNRHGSDPVLAETSDEWASLAVDARSARTSYVLQVAESIVEQARSGPLMLVVDDVQWADLASLLLLSALLDTSGHGLFLVCLSRPDGSFRREARGLVKSIQSRCHKLELRGLMVGETHEFSNKLLGRGTLSEAEAEVLCSRTGGNPLFLRALLQHLKDSDLLAQHGVEEALERSDIPTVLSDAVDLAINDLGSDVRHVLSAAAVLGQEFESQVLAALVDQPEDRVAGLLRAARQTGIISSNGNLRSERIRFGHPLYRQRLYEMQAPNERRRLHGRVIEIAEQSTLDLSEAELATHHTRSRPPGANVKAVAHCRAAAVRAERLFAYESAARFWEMALDCVERSDKPSRAEFYKRQGWALWAGNSWKRSEGAWRKAIDVYEALGNTTEVAELALAIGDMMRWRQHLAPSEEWIRKALPDLPEHSSSRARALSLLGSIQCLRGSPEEGLKTLQEAVRATEAGNSDARIDFWLSYGLRRAGDPATANAVAERGLHQAEAAGDTHSTIMLSAALARTELIELRPDLAEPYLARLERHADQADTAALLVVLQTRALRMGYAGEWEPLSELCNATRASLRLAGGYQLASVNVFWAEAEFAQGNWRGAVRALKEALPALEEMQDLCRVHLARILAASGEGAQALDHVRTYLNLALKPGLARSGVAVMADAAAAIDDSSLWEPAYELALKEPGHLTFVYSPTSVDRVRGRLAARLKKWDDSTSHFENAIEHLSAGGAVWELLRTYQDFAVMRRVRGRRGDAAKADALEIRAERTAQESLVSIPQAGAPYAARSSGNMYGLTSREVEVLQLVAAGLRNKEVADRLSISPHTVERHLENIYSKMDVRGRVEAVTRAAEGGVLTPTR